MSLFGVSGPVIKPTALTLNIMVSSFTSWRYIKNKFFDLKLVLPLVAGAIPCAFLGGRLQLPADTFKTLLGATLILAGLQFAFRPKFTDAREVKNPPLYVSVLTGAAIGFISGITGTGGGIFLSPLMLAFGWTAVRAASGTASVFILANSASGLLGNFSSISSLPTQLPLYVAAVMVGAFIGTRLGIKSFSNDGIKRALGAVLVIAGLKLFFHL
jgi:uncharacterized membrane protein YfcA